MDGYSIPPSPVVRNLGVILDPTLSFQSHINNVTRSAFYHLKNIARLRLSDSVTETLIHCFISTRLYYCNVILTGLPSKTLNRLQYVQNSAARVLNGIKPWQPITPTLMQPTGYQSSSAFNSKFYYSHTSPFTLWAPVTSLTSSTPTPPCGPSGHLTRTSWQFPVRDSRHLGIGPFHRHSVEPAPPQLLLCPFRGDFQKVHESTPFL